MCVEGRSRTNTPLLTVVTTDLVIDTDTQRDGGFGAPSPSTTARVADVLSSHTLALLLIAAVVVSIILGVRLRRTMRSRQIRNANHGRSMAAIHRGKSAVPAERETFFRVFAESGSGIRFVWSSARPPPGRPS
jgi:hypothetical protein